jgi:hypothetical protein
MAKPKKKLLWLQVCEPCSNSVTGKHEFYVTVSGLGKIQAKWKQWRGKLDVEAMSRHKEICPRCKKADNVKIKALRERRIQDAK